MTAGGSNKAKKNWENVLISRRQDTTQDSSMVLMVQWFQKNCLLQVQLDNISCKFIVINFSKYILVKLWWTEIMVTKLQKTLNKRHLDIWSPWATEFLTIETWKRSKHRHVLNKDYPVQNLGWNCWKGGIITGHQGSTEQQESISASLYCTLHNMHLIKQNPHIPKSSCQWWHLSGFSVHHAVHKREKETGSRIETDEDKGRQRDKQRERQRVTNWEREREIRDWGWGSKTRVINRVK